MLNAPLSPLQTVQAQLSPAGLALLETGASYPGSPGLAKLKFIPEAFRAPSPPAAGTVDYKQRHHGRVTQKNPSGQQGH